MMDFDTTQFAPNGFALVPQVLADAECEVAIGNLASISPGSAGTRNLLAQAWCQDLAARLRRHPALSAIVPAGHVAVQCTYFEKSQDRNWLVPFHQDLSIPVAARVERAGLSGWSEKEGGLFVHAPPEVSRQLLALRLHLDRCGSDDGPLRVVPGSHLNGTIGGDAAATVRAANGELVCLAEKGSVLALRPLLLHASSKSTGDSKRRVLHFLFGPPELPFGLRWQIACETCPVKGDAKRQGDEHSGGTR